MRYIYQLTWTQTSKDPKSRPQQQLMQFVTEDVARYNAGLLESDKNASNIKVTKIPRL